jgi:putative transposase
MTAKSNTVKYTTILKQLISSDLPEAMRQQAQEMLNAMMEEEVTNQTGAPLHAKDENRITHRNGYRIRKLETQLGCLDVRIPRLRSGTYYPSFLEPHCRLHASLSQVVIEAYTQGVSTRKVDELAQALGMSGISKSAVSRMLETLSEGVAAFCSRPIPTCPYVFFDARYENVREHGCIVSKAVLVAVGVTTQGRRELLGYDVVPSESEGTWKTFIEGLVARGLTGVRLVVSDAHGGLRRAIQQALTTSTWQRCSIHLGRNLANEVSHRHRAEVLGLLKIITTSPDIATARQHLKMVLTILSDRHPKAARVLEQAGEDFLAFLHFPDAHRRKLHSTNLVERLNREIKRRTRVVSIFPSGTSLLNLVGAVLEHYYITWAGESYMSVDSMRELVDPLAEVRDELAASGSHYSKTA